MKKDLYIGVFFLVLGVFLWTTIPYSIPHDDQLTQMGPRFFPTFLSVLLTLLGAVLAVQAHLHGKKREIPPAAEVLEMDAPVITMKDEIKVAVLFCIMILSCVLFIFFRYIVAMPLAATAMLLLYNEKKWHSYVILYLFIALFYFIFVKLMYVQL
jgi:hypothetical protein